MKKRRRPSLNAKKRPAARLSAAVSLENRILILAPTGNDARLSADFLAKANFSPHICRDLADLCQQTRQGCGTILLAEETLVESSIMELVEELAHQPPWSDVPIVVICSGGEASQLQLRRLGLFGTAGNVSLLERPFRPGTLISALQAALHARKRQYEVRTLLKAVSESEAKFRTLTTSAPVGIFLTDPNGAATFFNQSWCTMAGMDAHQALGDGWLKAVHPEDRKRVFGGWQEAVLQGRAANDEFRFVRPDGTVIWVQGNAVEQQDASGRVTGYIGSCSDITERKHAEQVAEGQRTVLQLIAEDAPLPKVLEALVHSVEAQFNKRVLGTILFLEKDGLHLTHGVSPNVPAGFAKAVERVAIGPTIGSCGKAAYHKKAVYSEDIQTDPHWKAMINKPWARRLRACWSTPIFSRHGTVLGTFALFHLEPGRPQLKDIKIMESAAQTAAIAMDRKASETEIRDSERRYSELVQSLPAAVYTTDAQGRITLYNEAAVVLWGRKPEVGKDLWCGSYRLFKIDGSPLPMDQCPMAITLKEGRRIRGQEIIVERADGVRRNVVPYPNPILDDSGRVVGAVNMLLDVTEARLAEANSRQLAAIVESSQDAIVSKDLNSIIKSWNRGATRLFGYTAEEIVGRSVTMLMSPDCWAEEAKILQRIRQGEHLEHYETVRQHKDGSRIEVSLTLSPMKDGDGQITGTSMIIRDITGQKQAKRDLERAHKELLAASGAKDDFIAALSHELRTPLNPVLLLASEAAEDPGLPATVRDQFNQIRNNVELEARLIDDLLDITRISRGKLSLHMNAVDVHAVLKESLTTISAEIGEKQIIMKLDLAAEHHVVRGDAVRLQQVFWNVLKNAAKFTPAFGKIEVQTRNEDNGDFTVMITDTGIGMNEAELARIFEAFAQGEHAKTSSGHRFGGLGLGLAICRMLVESHAGTIRAASRGQNQGSTFYVTLPTIKKEIPETQPQKNGAGTEAIGNGAIASLRILLVEDHEPTRKALGQLLTRRQHEVKLAASAAEARELFSQNNFQLLISDIGLPDGNGFELMKEFRSRNRNLWGIALTGYGMEQDMARSEEAGFISHLTKPIRVQSLDLILATLHDN